MTTIIAKPKMVKLGIVGTAIAQAKKRRRRRKKRRNVRFVV